MSATGYIKNGVYHKVATVPLDQMQGTQQSMYKQGDHARQRFDHAAEIIQPYTHDGQPNPAMIEAWPDDAATYGFLPQADPGPELREASRPAHGSVPWGQ